ncbi:MAG: kinase to dihydroxyacetone kinase [Clostridiales bacterium]|nr:kinase to dihydroxyacetone kinase [Clostridiales bacterium]
MSEENPTEFRYDTQLLLEGKNLNPDGVRDYFEEELVGDSLLVVGDSKLVKIHFHTNEPWKVLEFCAGVGEIYDIVIEDMVRQSKGLQG